MDGWIVRFNKGVTYRANSVLPLNWFGDDLQSSVNRVEVNYQRSHLSSIFMLHDNYEPEGLESLLIDRSYDKVMPTYVMGSAVSKIVFPEYNSNFINRITDERLPTWYSALEELSPWRTTEKLKVMGEIMDRVATPKKRYIFSEYNGKIVGVMLAIVDRNFMGILNLAVDQKYKRKGVATSLIKESVNWAISKDVYFIYLQVEKKNTPAVNLYKKLGFKEWYSYRYYEKKF